MNIFRLINFLLCTQLVVCRDFYVGMFRRNDYLVAQDVVYKEASHFGYVIASYGRYFKCPITYFRVVDRLGMGRGPYTSIVRGGLGKKYIAVRIKSTYNLPVSVNIYVGCENKSPTTVKRLTTHAHKTTLGADAGGGPGGGPGGEPGAEPDGETSVDAGEITNTNSDDGATTTN